MRSLIICFLVFFSVVQCTDEIKESVEWDSGPISISEIEAINGGAIISYEIPNDNDLLYIMAEYERNGKSFTEKSSIYNNYLKIEGFGDTQEVLVDLYKVNKNEEKSQPLKIKFIPLEPVVSLARESLEMSFTFGGVYSAWENSAMATLGVHFLEFDGEGYETKEVYFSSAKSDQYAFRGFEAEESRFGIYFEDQWGNLSDTAFLNGSPLYETLIKKPYIDFRAQVPYDNNTDLSSTYHFSNIWDNIVNTAFNGWLTQPGSSGLSITIDLGKPIKLSRIVIHGYHQNAPYGQVNVTNWEGWGTNEIDLDKLDDKSYWLDEESVRIGAIQDIPMDAELPAHTFKDDWDYLGYHEITRYDLMTPPDPQGVLNLAENGMEYTMPIDVGPIRYFRFYAREVEGVKPPPNSNYFSMGEITFYGDDSE